MKNITKVLIVVLFLVFAASTVQAFVSVMSPEAGEVWKIGQYGVIEWQMSPSVNLYKIELWEDSAVFSGGNFKDGNAWRINEYVNGNSYVWKVGDVDCGGSCTTPPAGKYKIVIRDQGSTVLSISDTFNLVPSTAGIARGSNVTIVKVPSSVKLAQKASQQAVASVSPAPLANPSTNKTQMASALQAAQQSLIQMLSYLKGLLGQ